MLHRYNMLFKVKCYLTNPIMCALMVAPNGGQLAGIAKKEK